MVVADESYAGILDDPARGAILPDRENNL